MHTFSYTIPNNQTHYPFPVFGDLVGWLVIFKLIISLEEAAVSIGVGPIPGNFSVIKLE